MSDLLLSDYLLKKNIEMHIKIPVMSWYIELLVHFFPSLDSFNLMMYSSRLLYYSVKWWSVFWMPLAWAICIQLWGCIYCEVNE